MSKRIYRSTPVNAASAEALRDVARGRDVVIGVDVAKTQMKAVLMERASRDVLGTMSWRAPTETRAFVDLVASVKASASEAVVALEPTGTYGDVLRGLLAAIDVAVFRVSPKHTSDMSEVYDGVPSQHDAKCAAIIARLHAEGRSTRWVELAQERRDLLAAVDTLTLYERQLRACLGSLEGKLARHFPEAGAILSLASATLLTVIERFGDPRSIAAQAELARELMCKTGGPLLSSDKVDALIKAAHSSQGVRMTAAERKALMILAGEANRNRRASDAATLDVQRLGATHAPVQRMGEAIGPTGAAVIYAKLGDPGAYKAPRAFVKALGLNLCITNSGKPADQGRLHISKRGSSMARMYLYMAVLRHITHDPIMKAWYARKVERDNGKHKLRSVVALMRKLAAALCHVARGSTFDAKKLFDTERLAIPA